MSQAYLHSDNMEDVRERLENTITQSSVETMYDGEDCFITVTQRNETTGNESKWSFCVDFGDFRITMLEPVEDIEYFGSDNEIFGIIKNFLNGGSSREKRRNRPNYDSGEPIKITGFGNKIGSSKKSIKSSHDKETLEKVIRAYLNDRGYKDVKGGISAAADYIWQNEDYYTDYDLHSKVKQWFKETKENYPETLIKASRTIKSGINDILIGKSDNGEYSIYLSDCKHANHGKDPHQEYMLAHNGQVTDTVRTDDPYAASVKEHWQDVFHIKGVQSSRKPIKSDFNPYYEKHPDTFVAYLVGDKDSITQEDIDKAEKEWYKLMYAGYGSLYGETGHLFLGPYENVKSYVEDYLGVGLLDDYLYTYDKDDSVLDHFETQPDKPLPTEKDYQDFVNQLNKYVAENYETHGNYGPIYKFDMYKGEGTNSDGYGHEYPNFIIYDDEGNLDMHSDDDITEYIRNELKAKGWYPEAVHSSSDFTIAVM